jgi:hypothetical protein
VYVVSLLNQAAGPLLLVIMTVLFNNGWKIVIKSKKKLKRLMGINEIDGIDLEI